MTSQEKKKISSPNTIFSCGVSGFSCHWMQSNHPSCPLIKAGQIWLKKWDRRGISSKRSSVIQTYFLKDLLSPCLAPVPQERWLCTPLPALSAQLWSVLNTLYHHSLVMKSCCLLQTGQRMRRGARSENRDGHTVSGTRSATVWGKAKIHFSLIWHIHGHQPWMKTQEEKVPTGTQTAAPGESKNSWQAFLAVP